MIGRLCLLGMTLSGLVGCTLDFEEFRAYTPEHLAPPVDEPDIEPVDMLVDMLVDVGPPDADVAPLPPADSDEDGVLDIDDNCPMVANPLQENTDLQEDGGDACDDDDDDDLVPDGADNCSLVPNADQLDTDADELGDECDDDADGDGLENDMETLTDPLLPDTDFDGLDDKGDKCPLRADRLDIDFDMDGSGNGCDQDDDGDGIPDWRDPCPGTSDPEDCEADLDGDGVANEQDNCPTWANPDQAHSPCVSRFATATYTRAVEALTQNDEAAAVAATRGGAVRLTEGQGEAPVAPERITNAQGLSSNYLKSVSIDAQGNRWFVSDAGVSVVRSDGFVFNLHSDDLEQGLSGNLRDVEAIGERLYVSSDAGLHLQEGSQWSTVEGLPDNDVHGLWKDGLDNLWVVTQTGAVKVTAGVVSQTVVGAGEGFRNVTGDQETVWLLGTNGVVIVDGEGQVQNGGIFTGFDARDARLGTDRLIASADGLRRIDQSGRLFPPGTKPLPSTDIRGVARGEESTWVGTRAGIVTIDGYFSTFTSEKVGNCVTIAKRFGSLLWVGTDSGLRLSVVDPASPSETTFVPADTGEEMSRVNAIEQVGPDIWIGTNRGIFVFDVGGTYQAERRIFDALPGNEGDEERPVNDIVNGADGDVWAGTENGLVRLLANGTVDEVITTDDAPNLPNNNVTALAYSANAGLLYIATQSGIGIRSDDGELLVPAGVAQLQNTDVTDITVDNLHAYASTPASTEHGTPALTWSPLRRVDGDYPDEAFTDVARAVTSGDGYVYIATLPVGRAINGVILRRPSSYVANEVAEIYIPDEVGLLASSGVGGVSLEYQNNELFVSLCGNEENPGGLSVLSGKGLILEDHTQYGLQGDGTDSSLTYGLENQPLFATMAGSTPVADHLDSDFNLTPLNLRNGTAAPPVACGLPLEEGDELWCATKLEGLARRTDDNWGVLQRDQNARQLGNGDYRDILVQTNRQLWVAAGDGLVKVSNSVPRLLNNSGTGGGLPSNDVRCLALRDSILFVGTAEGIGTLNTTDDVWTPLGAETLPNRAITALDHDSTGRLWVGTEGGLFGLGTDGNLVSRFGTANGLPTLHINDLVVLSDDRVVVATNGGVSIGNGQDAFQTLGFFDGLPGKAAYQLVVTPTDEVWVRSADGVARILGL